jgi:DNA polymerase (family X)
VGRPHLKILGHPTVCKLLQRDAYQIDMPQPQASLWKPIANPNCLDLFDRDLRMAKESGCKIVINTDAHHTSEMEKMKYGVRQLRRAWLTKEDVLNTVSAENFTTALRPGSDSPNHATVSVGPQKRT